MQRLGHATRIEIDGKRLPGFSVSGDSTYYLLKDYGLRLVRYLNRTFGVEGGASNGRLTFPGSDQTREDRILRYDVGLRVRLFENTIGRRLEYRLRIGRYRRESTVPSLDRSQNTIGLDVVWGF